MELLAYSCHRRYLPVPLAATCRSTCPAPRLLAHKSFQLIQFHVVGVGESCLKSLMLHMALFESLHKLLLACGQASDIILNAFPEAFLAMHILLIGVQCLTGLLQSKAADSFLAIAFLPLNFFGPLLRLSHSVPSSLSFLPSRSASFGIRLCRSFP